MAYTTDKQPAHDYRPLGSRFQDCCRQTRDGGGLPESEEGGILAGITHDLVLLIDLPARRMEREERLLAMHDGDVNKTLHDICIYGGGKDARLLLAHGAEANHRGGAVVPGGELGWAAFFGHLAVVEALLDAGAGELEWALFWAANEGYTAIVTLLLDRGADVHYGIDAALYQASFHGRLDVAALLLQRGATAENHILARAVELGHHAVADLLRAHGAV